MPDSTVTLALDGDVPLEEFARTMGRFAELVNALSEEVGSPGLDWVVDDLQVSSAVATVRSSSDTQAAQKVVHAYTAVGSALENHTPVKVSRRVRRAANKVVSTQDKRVRAVRFETAEKDSVIPTGQGEPPRFSLRSQGHGDNRYDCDGKAVGSPGSNHPFAIFWRDSRKNPDSFQ